MKTYIKEDLKSNKSLEEQLSEGTELMRKFVDNQGEEVYEYLIERKDLSIIYAIGVGSLKFLDSLLTLDKEDMEGALNELRFSAELANRYRAKRSYTSYILGINYDGLTDEECIAELFYAKSVLLAGILSVLVDQSVYSFVNAALNIRAAHQSYKECLNIVKYRHNWESEETRMHFESGTRLGIGGFDLTISFVPSKLAKLLEFVGFCGDRSIALDELNQAVNLTDAVFYDISSIILCAYHGFLEYFYGLGNGDVEFFDISAKLWLTRTPNSSLVKLGLGMREMITGNPDKAIKLYNECIQGQEAWKQLHYACYWMITWSSVMKYDWENAAKHAKLLKQECKWSPSMFSYLYAIFSLMKMNETKDYQLESEISEILRLLPSLKRNIGGKKAFHEKIVINRSKRFHNRLEKLILPHLELMYIWNFFKMMNQSEALFDPFVKSIEDKLNLYKSDKDDEYKDLDRYAYLIFMRSVCRKELGFVQDAFDGFNEILNCKKRINEELHLLPQSAFEIGLIHKDLGNLAEAKKWLKKARDDYKGYLTENMIHFRVQTALDSLKN